MNVGPKQMPAENVALEFAGALARRLSNSLRHELKRVPIKALVRGIAASLRVDCPGRLGDGRPDRDRNNKRMDLTRLRQGYAAVNQGLLRGFM